MQFLQIGFLKDKLDKSKTKIFVISANANCFYFVSIKLFQV